MLPVLLEMDSSVHFLSMDGACGPSWLRMSAAADSVNATGSPVFAYMHGNIFAGLSLLLPCWLGRRRF
jgi:hypothetical protein